MKERLTIVLGLGLYLAIPMIALVGVVALALMGGTDR